MDNLNSHYASALSFDYNLQIGKSAMYADIICGIRIYIRVRDVYPLLVLISRAHHT